MKPAAAAALAAASASAHAQASVPAAAGPGAGAQSITITGNASRGNSASVAGFGDLPLSQAPFSATVISTRQLQDAGIASLADITRLDAGITDAYNPPGYWSQLAVRGYTLDNRYNYRRDGLPINAETVLPQANKQALEILKGTSGLQAGTSAPGGLMNLVVKRPTQALRQASLTLQQPGSVGVALDVGDRAGVDGQFGWRVNAGADRLDPPARDTRGRSRLLAAAVEWQATKGTMLEAEAELSHQSQPSVPGFSLLGARLPSAASIDPRINLNNQAWSLPVVFDGRTASLRLTQALAPGLDLVAHAMSQQLRTDDRIAFPFGCSAADDYTRYCSDGSFDLYDFRSDGERRNSRAMDVSVAGSAQAFEQRHQFRLGVLRTAFNSRLGLQAYNYVGSATIDGRSRVDADPSPLDQNTLRDESSTEWHAQDRIELKAGTELWLGLRRSGIQRASVRTDGSRASDYSQAFTTPWLAFSHSLGRGASTYASWGQGIESEVAPNRSRYTNAGRALPALKSRQFEAGLRQSSEALDWRLAAFDIERPEWRDIGACSAAGSCTRTADGTSRHRGLEVEAEWRAGAIALRGSAMALQARRQGSAESSFNGLRPANVPATSMKLQAAYNVADVPGLALLGFLTHEGQRMVLPDNSTVTPGWTRLDLAARYTQVLAAGRRAVWRVGVDNVADLRAWKEAPFQYDHAYLYPLAPRSLHGAVSVNF